MAILFHPYIGIAGPIVEFGFQRQRLLVVITWFPLFHVMRHFQHWKKRRRQAEFKKASIRVSPVFWRFSLEHDN